jgi:hypothetical protein
LDYIVDRIILKENISEKMIQESMVVWYKQWNKCTF